MAKKASKKRSATDQNGKTQKKAAASKLEPEEKYVKVLPIEREVPSAHQVSPYANHFVIQHDASDFYLMFFQIQQPLVVADTLAERRAEADKMKSVKAICVSRVTISASRMPDIIQAMQANLANFRRMQESSDAVQE